MTLSKNFKKCKGCGSNLSLNKQDIGYVPKIDNNVKLCYRCFQLKHYNNNIINNDIVTNIKTNVNNIELNNKNVFLITDILDLYATPNNINESYNKLFLIINKMDLFNKQKNIELIKQRIIKNIDYLNIKYNEVFFISTKIINSIKRLNYFINHLNKNEKNIFIGKSNVGKSSIINSLLKINKLDANLTTNNALNTTINIQKIKLNKHYIIDTPGINDESNILNWIDQDRLNKINFTKNNASAKTFQIKYQKRIIIENIVAIDITPNNQNIGSITFYLNKNLSISSKKITDDVFCFKDKINYKQNDLKIKVMNFALNNDNKANITISGLGLISTKNIINIKIHILDPINVYQWKYIII